MGDFKGLADKLKIRENKYVLEAGKLTIGKGVISHDDNILIPLNAISLVEILEQEKSEQSGYELKIQNHAGTCFYITASDMGFIREIRAALMICFGDGNAVYSGRQRALAVGENKIYGEEIAAINIYTDGNNYAEEANRHTDGNNHVEEAQPEEKSAGRAENITILDDEWKTLEDYALQRMKDFAAKDRNHTICEAMAAAAELHNREKCKLILDVSGNDALDMIIVGAPIAVKAIVNKIM